jgi:hypothetical protein
VSLLRARPSPHPPRELLINMGSQAPVRSFLADTHQPTTNSAARDGVFAGRGAALRLRAAIARVVGGLGRRTGRAAWSMRPPCAGAAGGLLAIRAPNGSWVGWFWQLPPIHQASARSRGQVCSVLAMCVVRHQIMVGRSQGLGLGRDTRAMY